MFRQCTPPAQPSEIGGELFAAGRQIYVLLNLVPVDVVQTRIDLQGVIQELVLAAELVAPQAVGAVLPGYLGETDRIQARAAEAGAHGAIETARAKAFRAAQVDQVVAIGLPRQHRLRRHRIVAGARAAVDPYFTATAISIRS
jgi:hypothetical protein